MQIRRHVTGDVQIRPLTANRFRYQRIIYNTQKRHHVSGRALVLQRAECNVDSHRCSGAGDGVKAWSHTLTVVLGHFDASSVNSCADVEYA